VSSLLRTVAPPGVCHSVRVSTDGTASVESSRIRIELRRSVLLPRGALDAVGRTEVDRSDGGAGLQSFCTGSIPRIQLAVSNLCAIKLLAGRTTEIRDSPAPILDSKVQEAVPLASHASLSPSRSPARTRLPQMGRSPTRGGPEAVRPARTGVASISADARGRQPAPHHGPRSRRTAESAAEGNQERRRTRVRSRRRSLRIPTGPVLPPVEPHPSDRRSRGSRVALARHAGLAGSRGPRPQSPLGSERIRLCRPIPCEGAAHAAGGEGGARLRAAQRETPRHEAARARSLLVRLLVRRLEGARPASPRRSVRVLEIVALAGWMAAVGPHRDSRVPGLSTRT